MADETYAMQLISGDGKLDERGWDNFVSRVDLSARGLSYGVLSIIGPQSSGKSTLLNHAFKTNFKTMDASEGFSQTTNGIWLSKAVDTKFPTVILDVEGSDGKERGEDDTSFERKAATFAFAVSNVVLVNMPCNTINRVDGGGYPLLRTTLQVISGQKEPQPVTLLFVLRDKNKTPLSKLEADVKKNVQEMWYSIRKQSQVFEDLFKVEVHALASYEYKPEQFREEALKQQIIDILCAGNRQGYPASVFFQNIRNIWNTVRENKDLDFPSHRKLVAKHFCEEYMKQNLQSLSNDKKFQELEETIKKSPGIIFREEVKSILQPHLDSYIEKLLDFDESTIKSSYNQFLIEAYKMFKPAFDAALRRLHCEISLRFKENVKKSMQALDDSSKFDETILHCIDDYIRHFKKLCQDMIVDGAEWDSSYMTEDLKDNFAGIAKGEKEAEKKRNPYATAAEVGVGMAVAATVVATVGAAAVVVDAGTGGVFAATPVAVALAVQAGKAAGEAVKKSSREKKKG